MNYELSGFMAAHFFKLKFTQYKRNYELNDYENAKLSSDVEVHSSKNCRLSFKKELQ